MKGSFYSLLFLLTVFGAVEADEGGLVFQLKSPKNEKWFTYFSRDVYYPKGATIKWVKQRVEPFKLNGQLVSATISKVADGRIKLTYGFRVLKPSKLLFERSVSANEKLRYVNSGGGYQEVPKGIKEDEIVAKYNKEYWLPFWTVIRVELVYRGRYKGNAFGDPVLQVYNRSSSFVLSPKEKLVKAAWEAKTKARYQLPVVSPFIIRGWTVNRNHRSFNKGPKGLAPQIYDGIAGGRYVHKRDKKRVVAIQVLLYDDGIEEHELYRPLMIGPSPPTMKLVHRNLVFVVRQKEVGAYAWLHKGDFFQVSTSEKMGGTVLKALLRKYPSDFKRKLKIDHDQWARKEVELCLARMDAAIKDKQPRPVDWFRRYAMALLGIVSSNELGAGKGSSPDTEQRRVFLAEAKKWWDNNRGNLKWDSKTFKLVVGK